MGNAKKSTWIGGTAFLAVVMMAMAWFLLISPVFAQADDTKAQTKQTEEQNVILKQKVDKLRAEFAHLEEYKAELAGLQKGIPTTIALSSYLRQLNDVAAQHSVFVTQITPSTPEMITLAAPDPVRAADATGGVSTEAPAPEATATPSPSASAGAEAGDGTTTPPAAPKAPAGMSAVPVSIVVVGTYQNTMAFLDGLQRTERLFLVGALTGMAQEEQEQQQGKPATELADLELTVDGYIWVLPDGTLAAPGTDEPQAPLPVPGADVNPFMPIEGSDAPGSSSEDD